MKRFKGLLVFVLVFISAIILNSTKCFAEEVQYTDNVIPQMTSNTSPSGEASGSIYGNGAHEPWNAFNHTCSSMADAWAVKGSAAGWLAYEFPKAKCITKYTITSRNPVNAGIIELPKNWTFEAWDEELNKWIILDKQTNIINWSVGVKKEFKFINTNLYNRYRINITANGGNVNYTAIGELEMMETISSPTNLSAVAKESSIQLSWDTVTNAESYNIKRSTTPGGPYDTIATGSAITFNDSDVDPGTTYYYVVSAMVSGTESQDSNEASATLPETPIINILKVVLEVNEQLQLSVDDDLDKNTDMIWTSSDNAVAIVDGYGVVTALTPGNTVITVTSVDGTYTDYINILVVDDAKDLRLAVDLKVGKSCRLTVDDLSDTVNVTWASMDPSVANVTSNGKVTAVSKGLALVTATDDTGKLIGQIYVRVRE